MFADAAPITYTFTATVSGDVDSVSFTDALFTFVGVGDTTAVTNCGTNCWNNNITSATITLAGFGTGTLNDSTFVFIADDLAGIADFVNFDLLYFTAASVLGQDLASSYGPLSGTATPTGQGPFNTSFGTITMTSLDSAGTFQASLNDVPEPMSIALTAAGLAALAFRRYRSSQV